MSFQQKEVDGSQLPSSYPVAGTPAMLFQHVSNHFNKSGQVGSNKLSGIVRNGSRVIFLYTLLCASIKNHWIPCPMSCKQAGRSPTLTWTSPSTPANWSTPPWSGMLDQATWEITWDLDGTSFKNHGNSWDSSWRSWSLFFKRKSETCHLLQLPPDLRRIFKAITVFLNTAVWYRPATCHVGIGRIHFTGGHLSPWLGNPNVHPWQTKQQQKPWEHNRSAKDCKRTATRVYSKNT